MSRWLVYFFASLTVLFSIQSSKGAFCDNLLRRGLISRHAELTESLATKAEETTIYHVQTIISRINELLRRPENLATFYTDPLLENIRLRQKNIHKFGLFRLAHLRADLNQHNHFAAVTLRGESEILSFFKDYVDGRGVPVYPVATTLSSGLVGLGALTALAIQYYLSLDVDSALEAFKYPLTYVLILQATSLTILLENEHVQRAQRAEEAQALAAIIKSLGPTDGHLDRTNFYYFYRDYKQARIDVIFSYEGDEPVLDIIIR